MSRPPFTRSQRITIVYGILCIVLVLVVLQLWLLTATMDAFLSSEDSVLLPAALVSLGCFLLAIGLVRYLYRIERQ
jgi:hypothetical protein